MQNDSRGQEEPVADGATMVMVGTRKGLWIGRSDAGREHVQSVGQHVQGTARGRGADG